MMQKIRNMSFKSALIQNSLRSFGGFRTTTYLPKPGDGKVKGVTLIPGEGIGPELTDSVQEIFTFLDVPIQWDIVKKFTFDDPHCLQLLKKNKTIIKGPISNKMNSSIMDNMHFSRNLNLFANISHGFTLPGIKTRHMNLDIVVIRENSEGEYSNIEHEVYPGVIESIKLITKAASSRVAEYAFEYAYLSYRRKVTAVHKANIMKLCDGQFLEATREVAKKYPSIQYEEIIVDNCCMQLTLSPQRFDVMLMPNLYGAIISNVVAGLVGGAGLVPGANIGEEFAMFETGTRHSGSDIVGKGIANPTAFILTSVMMLRHVGLPYFADIIQNGIFSTLEEGKIRTPDIGGKNTTKEFTRAVLDHIQAQDSVHRLKRVKRA